MSCSLFLSPLPISRRKEEVSGTGNGAESNVLPDSLRSTLLLSANGYSAPLTQPSHGLAVGD